MSSKITKCTDNINSKYLDKFKENNNFLKTIKEKDKEIKQKIKDIINTRKNKKKCLSVNYSKINLKTEIFNHDKIHGKTNLFQLKRKQNLSIDDVFNKNCLIQKENKDLNSIQNAVISNSIYFTNVEIDNNHVLNLKKKLYLLNSKTNFINNSNNLSLNKNINTTNNKQRLLFNSLVSDHKINFNGNVDINSLDKKPKVIKNVSINLNTINNNINNNNIKEDITSYKINKSNIKNTKENSLKSLLNKKINKKINSESVNYNHKNRLNKFSKDIKEEYKQYKLLNKAKLDAFYHEFHKQSNNLECLKKVKGKSIKQYTSKINSNNTNIKKKINYFKSYLPKLKINKQYTYLMGEYLDTKKKQKLITNDKTNILYLTNFVESLNELSSYKFKDIINNYYDISTIKNNNR